MFKKFIFLSALLFVNYSYADTCPTVAEIKLNQLNHWQFTDLNSAQPANPEKIRKFKQKVSRFVVASWEFDEFGCCHYYGKSGDPNELGVFLQKVTTIEKTKTHWRHVDADGWICEAGISECRFG